MTCLLTEITEEEDEEDDDKKGDGNPSSVTEPEQNGDSCDSAPAETSQRPIDLEYGESL